MTCLARTAARIAAALTLLLLAAPVFAQRIGQGTGTEVPIWRVLIALALCLGLAVGAAYVLRRRLGGAMSLGMGRSRRLQLVESLRLTPQVHICLVSCDGAEFLVAASPQGAAAIEPGAPLGRSEPVGEDVR